jgi:hypothetical protein
VIRYVLVAILAVAIIGVSMPMMQDAAEANGERRAETAVADIEAAAVSLLENEELSPPGEPGPRRFVDVRLPGDSFLSAPLVAFEIDRIDDRNASEATYQVEGRTSRTTVVDAPIVAPDGRAVVLGGDGNERTLALTLERGDDGNRVVVLRRQ